MKQQDFYYSTEPEPHKERTKKILKAHPEVRNLISRNNFSFLLIVLIVSIQISLAVFLSDKSIWLVLIVAYFVGAFANHALFVLIHEAAHNLIFKSKTANMISSIIADIPNSIPTAISFRSYHLKHHSFQGDYYLDADLASRWEAKLIGNTFLGKAFWLLFFPVFQALRPPRLKEINFLNKWTVINWIVVFGFDLFLIYNFGWSAFLYFIASLFFSVGLHPLGARWIQEHYLTFPPQETYGYYGPLNILALNVGYHNEHHDFPSVPWNKLPQLKKMAPEFYDNLKYHKSWVKLLFRFLFDKNLSLFSRMVRNNRGGLTTATE
ncbi:MAG: fatty acid desaturase [Melioribacteraceae bacterium]|nr:fatty acid desaturase [Melioribacteraceae bacterium]